jgi:hypothetical protein
VYIVALSYQTALLIDLLTIVACVSVLVPLARLSHLHPATVYLIFHLFTFTSRLIGLRAGSHTLYSPPVWDQHYEPVRESEIVRAALLADGALVCMTLAWVVAAFREHSSRHALGRWAEIRLQPRIVWPVALCCCAIGVVGVALFSTVPGVGPGPAVDTTSTWFTMTPTWLGLGLLSLIYLYGFQLSLLAPMGVYLFVMVAQGYHRVRVIIPVVLMMQIYLDANHRRWPKVGGVAIFLTLALAFFPMKVIGRSIQSGLPVEQILEESAEVLQDTLEGRSGDHFFLDEFASMLTLVDANGKLYWGQPYLALLTLPVPRVLWPGKPSTADFIADFSRPWRPMSQDGMIVTILGEAYANFGYLGIAFMPPLIAYLLALVYFRAQRAPYDSLARFGYTLIACNLIQVYRDGLVSLFVFTVVNMLPLIALLLLHRVLHRRDIALGP